ncbi:MAG: sugar ABC transporter permease [Treponema sp.]|jgi:multiple sugar transport system permease protein|nr:sugar ABC transporter permease [Treponema sp.]
MIGPTVAGILVLNIFPFIQTIILGLSSSKAFGAYEFSGLKNYADMVTSLEFWKATRNTLWFCVLTVIPGVAISVVTAALLNIKIKGRGFFRALYFLPMVVSPAAVALVWRWIFNTEYGIINSLVQIKINWLTNSNIIMYACAIVAVWSALGYDAVLLLSGIQNISRTYYEAAEIDGASKFRQFFSITLPMISPVLFFVIILRVMASLKVYDLIYMMVDQANPVLPDVQPLMYLFYRESFIVGNKGYGSALAVWTVLLIGVVTCIQFIGQKRWVSYET